MSWEMLDPRLAAYVDGLVPEREGAMAAMEQRARETDFPIIGPAAGHFCYLLARLCGARRVFELGSGFGYSTAWFARAVQENGGGKVHHVVWDEDLSRDARGYLGHLGYLDLVEYHVGEAVAILRSHHDELFDIIFNDINKQAYPDALPVIRDKLRPGGLLIIDNMIWHGAIFDQGDRSADTEGVRRVTRMLTDSPDWLASMVPLRDGLILAIRR